MSQRQTPGRAFFGDSGVPAADVVVIEQFHRRFVRTAGAGGYKDASGPGQSYVVFEEIHDAGLRDRLTELVDSAGDVELEGRDRLVLDVAFEDGAHLLGCCVARPVDQSGHLERLRFLATLLSVPAR